MAAAAIGKGRNPSGLRAPTLAHQRAAEQATAFAGLPADANRFTVIGLLRRNGRRGGWNPRLIDHLELLIEYTRTQDWLPGARPVVWLTLQAAAHKLEISESQVGRNENSLMKLGALAFRDSGNRRRFGHRDADGNIVDAYGPDLSPAAALIPELTALAEARTRNLKEWHHLVRTRSAARSRVLATLLYAQHDQRLTDEAGQLLHDRITALGHRVHVKTPLEKLRRDIAALQEIEAALAAVLSSTLPEHSPAPPAGSEAQPLDQQENGGPAAMCRDGEHEKREHGKAAGRSQPRQMAQTSAKPSSNMQATAPTNARPALHGCKAPLNYITKDSYLKKIPVATGGRKGKTSSSGPDPIGQAPNRTEPVPIRVSFDALLDLVPKPMQTWLPVNRHTSWYDLTDAAAAYARHLGISQNAWGEACEVLGRQGATIAVIVIAAKYERNLISRPGGYLRAMTDRATTGELKLAASIYGLLKSPPNKDAGHA